MEFNTYKKKVLHIQLLPLLSGVQNAMLNLVTNLNPNEFEFSVISAPNGLLVNRLKELKVTHFPIPELKRRINIKDIIVFFKFYHICRKGKFNIVHTHSSKTGFLGRIAGKLSGCKNVIHTVHGFPFNQFQPKIIQLFYLAMEWIAAKFCDKIVFVNNSEREMAIKKKLVPSNKAITIYNGIKIPRIKRKKRFEEFKNNFIIGSVSRFSKQKNIINLISVAISVCQKNKNIKFVFIGEGELFSVCHKMVKTVNLQNQILLKGWQLNVIEWLQNFDVFVLYSKWEGLSIAILEAMSVGLPIVASDIKGNNELVSDENGILVSIFDIDKLVDILINLSHKRNDLIRLGKNSQKILKEKFSLEKFVKSYGKIYEL
ncbi:MAG: glycosyltransferase family 4 protein [Candidatus Cloacimonetes bacterium]|nr:glycosyltransferase family 4 protein [Candidatus Cloacimonadota bacterium]MCK4357147.1 glycosyltransferase family 4 protein [Candidatus Cloacimonadota bacterium]